MLPDTQLRKSPELPHASAAARKSEERPAPETNLWGWLAAAVVALIAVAAVIWSLHHPYGIHWDEAQYLNDAAIDLQRLRGGMLLKLGGRILIKSYGRPPIYRVFALPILALFGFHATAARLTSLICFGLSSWFIYLATRRFAGKAAGALAVLVFCLSPEIVSASIFFSTDAPLYLATAAMLYYVFVCWDGGQGQPGTWIGLGLAVGVGCLAKTSFFALVLPLLAFWFVAGLSGRLQIPSLWSQRKAAVLGILVAAPWWLLNIKPALAYTQFARDFVRNSLGPPSITTWMRWLNTVFQGLLGAGAAMVVIAVFLVYLYRAVARKDVVLGPLHKAALGACACAGLPIVAVQLAGTNHLLRHISPAVIPLAIGVGLLADRAGWTRSRPAMASSGVLCCAQLLMILAPVAVPNTRPLDLGFVNGALPSRVFIRFEQWDWEPLRELSYSCGVGMPRISYLGDSRAFNVSQIQFPWAVHAPQHTATVDFPDVTWLWRYEEGPLDWGKVMAGAEQSDIVVTAPHYVGNPTNKEDVDNEHNAELAERLARDPLFSAPVSFTTGRFDPVQVLVFVKSTFACRPVAQPARKP